MPHLLVERLRSFPNVLDLACCRPWDFPIQDLAIEALDLVAAIIFILGSVCFLPELAKDLQVFLTGCILYVVGSVILLAISAYTLLESALHHKALTSEVLQSILYVIGAWFFLAGTFMYWPAKAHYMHIELIRDYAFGQYFNLYSPEFEGTLLFVIGSLLLQFAAFTNALNHRHYEQEMAQMLTAVTTIHMGGDMLFVIGSVAFLPNLGYDDKLLYIGAWAFIVGSGFFAFAAVISMCRTLRIWKTGEHRRLLAWRDGPAEERLK